MAKWLLAYVITLILFPRVKPYVKNLGTSKDSYQAIGRKKLLIKMTVEIDKNKRPIENTIGKYEADIINGAINNNENGLYIPPVRYKRIHNCEVSYNKK